MEKKKLRSGMNALDFLNKMVSEPHYLLHFLAFFSYLVVRTSVTQLLPPPISLHLLRREIQALLGFSVLAVIKLVKEETWEGFIADTFFYAKIFLVAISLILDNHLTLWYVVLFSVHLSNYSTNLVNLAYIVHSSIQVSLTVRLHSVIAVIYLVAQQPAFEELGEANRLTPLQLETLLTEGHTSRYWLVEFRAQCSSTCIRASRCLPELSVTYSNKNLSFGIVDLGLFPNTAERFGISLNGGMSQLPTFILFDNATETARYPEWGFESKAPYPPLTKGRMVRHFDLDRLLLEYVNGK
ncbi:Thioredoxin-related transmembrane protein 2 [Linum perenne]